MCYFNYTMSVRMKITVPASLGTGSSRLGLRAPKDAFSRTSSRRYITSIEISFHSKCFSRKVLFRVERNDPLAYLWIPQGPGPPSPLAQEVPSILEPSRVKSGKYILSIWVHSGGRALLAGPISVEVSVRTGPQMWK